MSIINFFNCKTICGFDQLSKKIKVNFHWSKCEKKMSVYRYCSSKIWHSLCCDHRVWFLILGSRDKQLSKMQLQDSPTTKNQKRNSLSPQNVQPTSFQVLVWWNSKHWVTEDLCWGRLYTTGLNKAFPKGKFPTVLMHLKINSVCLSAKFWKKWQHPYFFLTVLQTAVRTVLLLE